MLHVLSDNLQAEGPQSAARCLAQVRNIRLAVNIRLMQLVLKA